MVIFIFDFGCKDTKFFDKLVIKSRFFSINGFFFMPSMSLLITFLPILFEVLLGQICRNLNGRL